MGNLSEYMSSPVITILPSKTVVEAAKLMAEKNIESLVVSWGTDAVGILTEKDIVRRVVAKELPYNTQVLEMMSKPVITINVDSFVEDAVRMMRENGVKRLPVEDKGLIIGIIAASDLANIMR
jgi:CBS domain-containing protein